MKPPKGASGVSAADKYAELEARGEERPRCECHGRTMRWISKPRPSGGTWTCSRHWPSTPQYRKVRNEKRRALYRIHKELGICVGCGKGDVISEVLCFDCLSYRDIHNLTNGDLRAR